MTILNQAVQQTGKGISVVFNWVTGDKALKERGLKRGNGDIAVGAVLSAVSTFIVTGLVVTAPLAPIFAIAAVATTAFVGGLLPRHVHARYLLAQSEAKEKAQKPGVL